jgi:eukaryotic-like serine/threonine-protein kinase
MTSDQVPHIDATRLGPLREVGAGAQGRIFTAPAVLIDRRFPAVYKEYHPHLRALLDGLALAGLIGLLDEVDEATGRWLCERAAWPAAVVTRDDSPSGYLMCQAPGGMTAAAEVLAGRAGRLDAGAIRASLAEVEEVLGLLHAHDVALGGVAADRLLLWLPAPEPGRNGAFLIGCDGCHRGGRVVLPAAGPGWRPESDRASLARLTAVLVWAASPPEDRGPAPLPEPPPVPTPPTPAPPTPAPPIPAPPTPAGRPAQPPDGATGQPAPDQPTPDQPAPDQPAPDQPAPDQPTPDRPAPWDRPEPAPALVQEPAAHAPARPARRWIPILTAAVVAILAVGSVAAVAVWRGTGGTTAARQAAPSAPAEPPVATAASGGSSGAPSTGRPPSAAAVASPAGQPSGRVGVVDTGAAGSDPRAADVAAMFNTYFSAINTHDYASALLVYDPAGSINPDSPNQRQAFISAVQTTSDTSVVLLSIAGDGSASGVLARVRFVSHQRPGYGPKARPGETCTRWDVTYQLRSPAAHRYRILHAATASNQPC